MNRLATWLQQYRPGGAALGLLVALLAAAALAAGWGDTAERKLLDARFRLCRDGSGADTTIVIADIGEADLDALEPLFGRWPWPRGVHGMLTEYLAACGARVIAFDVIFAEQSFSSVKPAQVAALQELAAALDSGGADARLALRHALARLLTDEDGALAAAGERTQRVVHALHIAGDDRGAIDTAALAAVSLPLDPAQTARLARAHGPVLPLTRLARSAKRVGNIAMQADDDGPVRAMPVLMRYERGGIVYHLPSLALAMHLVLREQETGRAPALQLTADGLRIDDALVPVQPDGTLAVDYTGGYPSYTYVPLARIILSAAAAARGEQPPIDPAYWQGKCVLVGSTAGGLMDLRVSPFDSLYPGVELHANQLDMLQHGRYLRRGPRLLTAAILLLLGLGFGWLTGRSRPLAGALWLLPVMAGYAALSLWLFARAHYWLDTFLPLLTAALTYLVVVVQRFISEEKEKRFVRNAFQHYLSRDVVDAVLANRQALKLGGERRELTVLFSDIRSFTTISEQMQPEEVVARLNEYLTAMTDIVLRYRGMLDKYVGDAVMAVYGAPLGMEDHAVRACRTALEMMSALREMQARWQAEGKVTFDIGIGINTGPMFVGNMGSQQLFDYTVIGDNVNLGARLEGINKQYGTHIIISESTQVRVQDLFVTRYLDDVTVKGKEKSVRIYELVSVK